MINRQKNAVMSVTKSLEHVNEMIRHRFAQDRAAGRTAANSVEEFIETNVEYKTSLCAFVRHNAIIARMAGNCLSDYGQLACRIARERGEIQ